MLQAEVQKEITYSITEHCKSPQGCDGLCEVLLGIVQLLDISANLLHHDLALVCLSADVIDLSKKLLYRRIGIFQVLPS